MKTTKKLIVMNYITQSISVYDYDPNIWEHPEDFKTEDGIYPIACDAAWMVVDKLNLDIN